MKAFKAMAEVIKALPAETQTETGITTIIQTTEEEFMHLLDRRAQ